jgi:hypothetical protein
MAEQRGESKNSMIGASSPGSQGAPRINARTRQAEFLAAVAGDCGCERCCGYRDIAATVVNPTGEF